MPNPPLRLLTPWFLLLAACVDPGGMPPSNPANNGPAPRPTFLAGSDVLVYAGVSAWMPEVDSLRTILSEHGIGSREVTSTELDSMSLDQIASYGLLIFPGGDAPSMRESLSAATHGRLRDAVQKRGVNYLGFCAGAWAAIAPAPRPGEDVIYGFGVVDGPIQEQTSLFQQGYHYAIDKASFPNGTRRDLLWYGGPVTPDIPGGVIAKYADGKPAVTQIWSGNGLVIVSGLHPAAQQYVFDGLGLNRPGELAFDFAWELLDGALHQKPLRAF